LTGDWLISYQDIRAGKIFPALFVAGCSAKLLQNKERNNTGIGQLSLDTAKQ